MFNVFVAWLGGKLPKGFGLSFPDENEHGWAFKIGGPHRRFGFLGFTEDVAIVRHKGNKTVVEVKFGYSELINNLIIDYRRDCPGVDIETVTAF